MKIQFSFWALCLTGIFFLSFTACTNDAPVSEAPAGGLSTDLVKNPRSLTQDSSVLNNALGRLQFTDTVHDFKLVRAGEVVSTEFEFKNTGKQDVLIYDAKVGCGCTVPEYTSAPIRPGETGNIKVRFNSEGKTGFNDKSILVHTNGDPAVYELHILAEVR
ncbi:MAG: DUF1573 domain-containing protein [Chitinophagaceae bacterium]|nr:DUF1573 domain-containing protein [Chitinophagaceae bacterium]